MGDEDSLSLNVMIDRKELARLQRRDHKLSLLEAGGVDNWEGYSEALRRSHKVSDAEWDGEED